MAPNRPFAVARTITRFGPIGVSAVTTTRSAGRKSSPRTTSGCRLTSRSLAVVEACVAGATTATVTAKARSGESSLTRPTLLPMREDSVNPPSAVEADLLAVNSPGRLRNRLAQLLVRASLEANRESCS